MASSTSQSSTSSLSFGSHSGGSSPITSASLSPPDSPALKSTTRLPTSQDEKLILADIPSLPSIPPSGAPNVPNALDASTPDRWVRRDARMIRLTGKHPFNSEAPLQDLFSSGFLTPASLFYVRSHGAVPQVDGEIKDVEREWTVRVHGLVRREAELSIADLKRMFRVVTLPVTLVCAGNRRKEQNIVDKSVGFHWGAAGLSTALFTGIYLSDLLSYVQPLRPAKHVIFEGVDTLPNGPYGTSQKLSRASNQMEGMLLAWAMNGEPLEPDHGYPLRLVVPGQIGGRSVKWLKRVEISEKESQHHLHFHDNKLLPTQLSAQRARDEKHWWKDPKYIINDLNVNSAIAKPAHNEIICLPSDVMDQPTSDTYEVRGYAYAGGGRRVTRVEISLDEGASWELAEVTYPEDLYRDIVSSDPVYGDLDLLDRETCFCWCFWTFSVPVSRLANSYAVFVRAADESLATQPRDMYWSATGMMNNWWFRVAIHQSTEGGQLKLKFEHPTLIGTDEGWMERMKRAGQDILNPQFSPASSHSISPLNRDLATTERVETVTVSMVNPLVTQTITRDELSAASKSSTKKPWFAVDGQVYDGTGFLTEHPGGADSIWLVAGEDASEDFMAIHSEDAKRKLVAYHIGTLAGGAGGEEEQVNDELEEDSAVFLHRTKWRSAKLVERRVASHDSVLFRFDLGGKELGLPIGQHVFAKLKSLTGEVIQRAYTPVSQRGEKGFVDLLVKLYLPNSAYVTGGRMSVAFNALIPGDTIQLKGPLGSFVYHGRGHLTWRDRPMHVKSFGLIAGGSGITPILQVLRAVLSDEEDETQLWMLDSNKSEDDVLCMQELGDWCAAEQSRGERGRLRIHHQLSKPPKKGSDWSKMGWSPGRITDEVMRNHLPPPTEDALVLVCGPDPLIKLTVQPGLERLGYQTSTSLVIF